MAKTFIIYFCSGARPILLCDLDIFPPSICRKANGMSIIPCLGLGVPTVAALRKENEARISHIHT